MLMITIEIGRQNSGCTCKGYVMNVHDGHALVVCLPADARRTASVEVSHPHGNTEARVGILSTTQSTWGMGASKHHEWPLYRSWYSPCTAMRMILASYNKCPRCKLEVRKCPICFLCIFVSESGLWACRGSRPLLIAMQVRLPEHPMPHGHHTTWRQESLVTTRHGRGCTSGLTQGSTRGGFCLWIGGWKWMPEGPVLQYSW